MRRADSMVWMLASAAAALCAALTVTLAERERQLSIARDEENMWLVQDHQNQARRAAYNGALDVDVVFSDISMPGLDGMALARVISRFSVRPQIVFVTAHDEHAVDAFALAATDYVMKPVRAERLSEAIRRVVVAQAERPQGPGPGGTAPEGTPPPVEDETIPVELGGVTRFITRSQIRYAQAHGDNNRTCVVRTVAGRLEWRLPDPACNSA